MNARYVLSTQAERDIEHIVAYIASDNPSAARQVLHAIEQTCALVGDMPYVGRKILQTQDGGVHALPCKTFRNYLVLYMVEPKASFIVRVLNARRDIPTLLSDWFMDNDTKQ